jgi:hypothetical protein
MNHERCIRGACCFYRGGFVFTAASTTSSWQQKWEGRVCAMKMQDEGGIKLEPSDAPCPLDKTKPRHFSVKLDMSSLVLGEASEVD